MKHHAAGISISRSITTRTRRSGSQTLLAAAAVALAGVSMALSPSRAFAQWSTTYEQFYLPGSSNWQFRHNYPAGDRLFNAFDYGHAILYERLWTEPNAAASLLEEKEYNFITRELLVHPPNLPLEEAAIEVAYAKLAPEAKMMFDWAHLLHRQIYDAWADERLTVSQKDARVHELVRYYKTRKDLAFSSVPKSMELMEGQPYSLAFRRKYPKFNGLIWAYHWLQIGLYEPLLAGRNKDERQTGVIATVARFRQMIENPPSNMPRLMPMSPAVAPLFTARYPEAAIIFDNLHAMHDVISDILANPALPRDQKRAAIMLAAGRYRDNVSFAMTPQEWMGMAAGMGIANMGGPVRGFLAGFPQPTVERGAVVAHGSMSGMSGATGKAAAGMAGMDHSNMAGMTRSAGAPAQGPAAPAKGMDHSGMDMGSKTNMPGMSAANGDHAAQMTAMHNAMMSDPVIRARVNANPSLKRMMDDMMANMASGAVTTARPSKDATARKAMTTRKPAARSTGTRRATSTSGVAAKKPVKAPAKPVAKKPAPKPDPMAGMDHSKMPMPPKK